MTDLHWFWQARGAGNVDKMTGFGCDARGRPLAVRRIGLSASGDRQLAQEQDNVARMLQDGRIAFRVAAPMRRFDRLGHTMLEMPALSGVSAWEMLRGLAPTKRERRGWALVGRLVEGLLASRLGAPRTWKVGEGVEHLRGLVSTLSTSESVAMAIQQALDVMENRLSIVWANLAETQPAHGDFWLGNVLFDGDAFGVVDWEHYGYYPIPFFDYLTLMVSSAVLLSTSGDGTLVGSPDWHSLQVAVDDGQIRLPQALDVALRDRTTREAVWVGLVLLLASRERITHPNATRSLWLPALAGLVSHK